MEAHNLHAGLGPVLLDIGDDIGAVVLSMPAELVGHEVEARPVTDQPHRGVRRVAGGTLRAVSAAGRPGRAHGDGARR